MSDIKAKLKEAREAVKNKDYETCYKLSKIILKEDRTNYMALIFLGLCLQELGPSDQALKAFEKAIEINPSNSLAWNGLISCYEKIDTVEAKQKLISLYSTIIGLEGTEKKIVEYCQKLANLNDFGDIKEISKIIYNCRSKDNIEKNGVCKVLVDLYLQTKSPPLELEDMYEECLLYLIAHDKLNFEYYSAYLNLLYKNKKFEDVLNQAEKMFIHIGETEYLMWICQIFNDSFFEQPELAKKMFEKVTNCYPRLLEIEPKNITALISKSIVLIKEEALVKAQDALREVVAQKSDLIQSWVLLTSVYAKLNLWEEAAETSLNATKLLKSLNNSNEMLQEFVDVTSIEILSKSSQVDDWKKALVLYEKIKNGDLKEKCAEFIIQININLQEFREAELLISKLKFNKKDTSTLLYAQLLRKQNKYEEALELLQSAPMSTADWWMEIGLAYWDKGEYKQCLVPFLKAAQCKPFYFLPFMYLGNVYKCIDNLDKARRCYEKALKINPKSSEIVTELCKIYRKLKNWDATHSLLEKITSGTINENNSWAWLQLGISYLEQEDYSNAINNLRYVARIQPENVHCWEALADAYFVRGSYTSAQKCYEKSLVLASNTLHSLLQIANIKMILGHYAEAKIDFESILLENEQYIPALKGLAETCIYQARQCYRDQRLGTSRDHIQIALENLILAIQKRSDLSCLWKLLADSCLFVANLPEKYSWMFLPKSFLECSNSEGRDVVERRVLYNIAARCYCKALSLIEDNILIWHDLAICYLCHAANTEDDEEVDQLFSHAMAASKYCAFSNHSNWQHWNLLGNIAMKKNPPNYALAQHCFIRAVTINHNSAISWTNLGVLYILLNNIKLANKAFAQGQRSDPNYVNSWIGQALVAEMMGHNEAMDLFRHSTQLGQHQQGGLGYGHWVCQTLLTAAPEEKIYSIHNMHAIEVACDALNWCTEKKPYDSCAWNMLGILYERIGLQENTLQAYKKAYRFTEKKNRDLTRINYGRILAKLTQYSEAIKIFEDVQEATFKSGCGLALALFKDKRYEESYGAYEQALHWLTEEQSSQSDLLVALASIAYMYQGVDAAKTLLFQSIQLKPPSTWSLYATLSLALLHNDLKLAELISSEMEIYKTKSACLKHYALLKSYTFFLQGSHDKAVKEIGKLVHLYPNNPSVWLLLSLFLIRISKGKNFHFTAAKCGLAAMTFGQINMDVTKVLCLVSLASSLAGNNHDALIAAQKAVHCYPDIAESWAMLILTLSNMKKIYPIDNLMVAIFSHIEHLNPTMKMLQWIKNNQ